MDAMIHEILPVGALQCNCSIIGDEATREAMVIDPGDEIEDILAIAVKHNLKVKMCIRDRDVCRRVGARE